MKHFNNTKNFDTNDTQKVYYEDGKLSGVNELAQETLIEQDTLRSKNGEYVLSFRAGAPLITNNPQGL